MIRKICDIKDWELVCILAHYNFTVKSLSKDAKNNVYLLIWTETDAYGPKGFIPAQGYDWSGIRDSSDSAKMLMAEKARKFLYNVGQTDLEYDQAL